MNFSLPSLFQILVVSLVTIIAFVKSRYSTSVFLPKYFVIFAPLAYLLFARALLNLSSSKLILRMAIGGVFYIFLAHLFFVIHYYDRDDKKEQFDEAFKIIASYGKMAQDWPMVSLVWRPEYLDYYLIRNKIMLKKGLNLQGDADDIQRVRQFVGNPWVNPTKKLNFDHFWFFSGHRIPDPQLLMMMGELYTPVKYSTLKGVQLILFKSKENAARAKQLGLAPAKDTEFQKIRSDTGVVDLTEMFSGR